MTWLNFFTLYLRRNPSNWWLIRYSLINAQVSTATGVISHFVNLQVVVPEAFILGSGELHVDMGSAINLVCIIEKVRLILGQLIRLKLLTCLPDYTWTWSQIFIDLNESFIFIRNIYMNGPIIKM